MKSRVEWEGSPISSGVCHGYGSNLAVHTVSLPSCCRQPSGGGLYLFPGPRGDTLLYPSPASTEDKDAARQWLADYYGVTLP